MNLDDPKIKRRMIILGENKTREIYVAEITGSSETDNLVDIIDDLVERLYAGVPAKLRISE